MQVLTQTRAYEAQQEYIARQEAYIRRFKAGIKSKMARGRQSQLERLERIDAPVQEEEFELRLPHAAECAEKRSSCWSIWTWDIPERRCSRMWI